MGASDVLHEGERPGAHDILLVPPGVLGKNVRLIDPVPRRSEGREERCGGPLQPKHDVMCVRGLHSFHVHVFALPSRHDAGRRVDDFVVGRFDVLRCHFAAIVEFHAPPKVERILPPVLGDRPRIGEIGDDLRARRIRGVDAQQGVVVRRQGMHHCEGRLSMGIKGRRLGSHDEQQLPSEARCVLCYRREGQNGPEEKQRERWTRDHPVPTRQIKHRGLLRRVAWQDCEYTSLPRARLSRYPSVTYLKRSRAGVARFSSHGLSVHRILITAHDTIVSRAADGLRKAALCQVTFGQLADEATDMSEVELLSGPHASRFTNTDIRTRQLLGHSFLKEQPPMPRSSKPARCFCLSRKFHAASKSR